MQGMSVFAKTVLAQKYLHHETETWQDLANRVGKTVLKAVGAKKDLIDQVVEYINQRKFIPGGRYLYATGRQFHQTQNCYAGETRIVTRYGTKTLKELSGSKTVLMSSKGAWVEAEIKNFGVQDLQKVVIQRAGIKKELFATAGHSWRIAKNLDRKSRRSLTKREATTEQLKTKDYLYQVFGAGILKLKSSLAGIQHGIIFGDGGKPSLKGDKQGFQSATIRLCGNKNRQLLSYFEGYDNYTYRGDIVVTGLPRLYKNKPSLESDRPYLYGWLAGYFAADGCVSKEGNIVLSSANRNNLEFVKDICYILGIGAYCIRSVNRTSNLTNKPCTLYSLAFMRETLSDKFFLLSEHRKRFIENKAQKGRSSWRVIDVNQTNRREEVYCAVVEKTNEFVLEDNILTGNCLLLRAEDSREGWAELMQKATMALMTGAGIGVDYSNVRAEGKAIRKTGGTSTGPLALAQMVNEAGRGIMQGGSRRSAIWAGLKWSHPDVMKFIVMKNWIPEVRDLKSKDFNFPATMDGTNISVQLDDEFFEAYNDEKHSLHGHAYGVYWAVVERMLRTAEPGFSVDTGKNAKETLRNACTEVTSADDSDICNLGSINLARIESLEEMKSVVEVATAFLLAGTVYSDVPYAKVDMIRTKNRRLGLGLMGVHEWLLLNGKNYGACSELDKYLEIYAASGKAAAQYADEWDLSKPIKTRAIAPTGTIGIIAETSTSLEPIFCSAFKRRYAKGSVWHYQYVLDPTVKRLVEQKGVDPEQIEDAYVLAEDVERRIAFQAHVQKYVDHAISSTINLPQWGSESNNKDTVQKFGRTLMKYLPQLRGITTYPDGSRNGQPLTPIKYSTAVKHVGETFVESQDICEITRGGSCGA